jgi:hypothetical protein
LKHQYLLNSEHDSASQRQSEGDHIREELTEFSLNSRHDCKQATHFALALLKNASGGAESWQSTVVKDEQLT